MFLKNTRGKENTSHDLRLRETLAGFSKKTQMCLWKVECEVQGKERGEKERRGSQRAVWGSGRFPRELVRAQTDTINFPADA